MRLNQWQVDRGHDESVWSLIASPKVIEPPVRPHFISFVPVIVQSNELLGPLSLPGIGQTNENTLYSCGALRQWRLEFEAVS